MFVVTTERRFTWPVEVFLPDTTGAVVTFEFTGEFRLLGEDEAIELSEAIGEAKGLREVTEANKAQVRRMLVGWDERVVGADKRPLPFSEAALEDCLTLSAYRVAVLNAYVAAVSGRPAPAEGN